MGTSDGDGVVQNKKKEPLSKLIIGVSVVIPLLVAALLGVKIPGYDLSFLPPVYASLNGLTAILLVSAVIAIKNGRGQLHQNLINCCVALSVAFLLMYVAYHATSDPTSFEGNGPIRYVYYVILITHILLSVVIIPLVLFTYVRAWSGNFERHRALAKFAFPLWLYVAVTGVIVYLMISPYYK
jgi:putative membrane protein